MGSFESSEIEIAAYEASCAEVVFGCSGGHAKDTSHLVSPTPAIAVRDQLIASGRLVPAKSAFQLPERRRVASRETTGTEVLTELRRDRLG